MALTKNSMIRVTGKSLNWPRNCFLIIWDKVMQEPSIRVKLNHLGSLHRASSMRREKILTKTRGKASFKVRTDIKIGIEPSHTSNPWWVTHSEAMEDSVKKGHLDRLIWEEMVDMNLTKGSITTNNQTLQDKTYGRSTLARKTWSKAGHIMQKTLSIWTSSTSLLRKTNGENVIRLEILI